ncbi:MAG: hypothetical protein WBW88_15735 [Rhodothermales bacterium]
MRRIGVAFFLAVAGGGCAGNGASGPTVPDSLLVDAIVAVYSSTAKAHLEGTDPDSARFEAARRLGLDTATVNRTIEYLADNPDSAAAVYQRALDSLIMIERDLKAAPDLDSLKAHIRG